MRSSRCSPFDGEVRRRVDLPRAPLTLHAESGSARVLIVGAGDRDAGYAIDFFCACGWEKVITSLFSRQIVKTGLRSG